MPSRLRTNAAPRISFFSFQDIITSVTGILILITLTLSLYLTPPPARTTTDPEERRRLDATLDLLTQVRLRNEAVEARLRSLEFAPDADQLARDARVWSERATALSNQVVAARRDAGEQARAIARRTEQLGFSEAREHAGTLARELDRVRHTNEVLVVEARKLEALERELVEKTEAATNRHRLWLLPDFTGDARKPVLVTVSGTQLAWERFNEASNRVVVPVAAAPERFAAALRDWHPARDYLVFYVRPSGVGWYARCRQMAETLGFPIGSEALGESQEIVVGGPGPAGRPGAPGEATETRRASP